MLGNKDHRLTEPVLKTVQAPNVVELMTGSKFIRTTNTYRIVPISFAQEDKGLVVEDASSETDKNWSQGHQTLTICDLSDGRGDGIEIVVP